MRSSSPKKPFCYLIPYSVSEVAVFDELLANQSDTAISRKRVKPPRRLLSSLHPQLLFSSTNKFLGGGVPSRRPSRAPLPPQPQPFPIQAHLLSPESPHHLLTRGKSDVAQPDRWCARRCSGRMVGEHAEMDARRVVEGCGIRWRLEADYYRQT